MHKNCGDFDNSSDNSNVKESLAVQTLIATVEIERVLAKLPRGSVLKDERTGDEYRKGWRGKWRRITGRREKYRDSRELAATIVARNLLVADEPSGAESNPNEDS